uniref:Uncharacterized protein n=1 Tax=Magallana gigas TaxID=29159 RepID=K1QZ75_MAGGI
MYNTSRALGVLIWCVIMVELTIVYKNFGQGLKERAFDVLASEKTSLITGRRVLARNTTIVYQGRSKRTMWLIVVVWTDFVISGTYCKVGAYPNFPNAMRMKAISSFWMGHQSIAAYTP